MSITLDGSNGITFPSGSTQNAACVAWAQFSGVGTSGSATVYGSYNISSITINSQGYFTINFSNSLIDGKYAVCGNASSDSGTDPFISLEIFANNGSAAVAPTSSSFICSTGQPGYSNRNPTYVSLAVFR